ncbi:unnamed protein product [Anisakis simplex]|uniref:SLC12 domain-containing protein n=1 Tax=Anisakis simplex TaxID=6269 RepID=A0A0M3JFR1_ANISI|nr:unnamed protein product [Anisakis simplex]
MEDVMPNLKAYLPKWSTSNQVNIIGVLNCQHTEISESVIAECRAFNAMRKLIYVTSEASKSFANLLALCASSTPSNSNRSEAFQLTSITPVDSHPHTDCFEWIIELNRNGCTA